MLNSIDNKIQNRSKDELIIDNIPIFKDNIINYLKLEGDEADIVNTFIDNYQIEKTVEKKNQYLIKNTNHYINIGSIQNYADSLAHEIKNLEHVDFNLRLSDLDSDFIESIDFAFHTKRYSYLQRDKKSKVHYDGGIDQIKGIMNYKVDNPYELIRPLNMFDPYMYFNHGIISNNYVRYYNYFNQNDSEFTTYKSLGLVELSNYIPDLYINGVVLSHSVGMIQSNIENDDFSEGFKAGLNIVYNPKGHLITMNVDTFFNISTTISFEVLKDINIGIGISFVNDTLIGSIENDPDQSSTNIGFFGNIYNTHFFSKYSLHEKNHESKYKDYRDISHSFFQKTKYFDFGLMYNELTEKFSGGIGTKNIVNNLYSQLSYNNNDNRLRGWINKNNVGILSPYISFDRELKNDDPVQRYNMGSNTINMGDDNYYYGFNIPSNIQLKKEEITEYF